MILDDCNVNVFSAHLPRYRSSYFDTIQIHQWRGYSFDRIQIPSLVSNTNGEVLRLESAKYMDMSNPHRVAIISLHHIGRSSIGTPPV